MNDIPTTAPRKGSRILNAVRSFSATEKAVFSLLVIIALATAAIMAKQVNDYFTVEVPAYGGTLREGVVGLPRTINPVLAVTDVDRDLTSIIYSGLTRYVDGVLMTDLAQSYEISEDGLTYTFTLKPKLKFHDGAPLTTEDIAFTILKIQDPALKSPRRADWVDVAVEVISPTQISFTLKKPYAPFLANTTIGIIPKHIWGSVSDDQFIFSNHNLEPVGSGPYRFDGITRNKGGIPTSYTVSTWRNYHGNEPYISSIVFKFFNDEQEGLVALDQGLIDNLSPLSPSAADLLARTKAQAYTVVSSPLPRVFGVFFNSNEAPILADRAVRVALDAAIDRQAIIDAVLDGYGAPLYGPVPPVGSSVIAKAAASSTETASTSTDYIAEAEAILERNGWKKEDGIYTKKSGNAVQTIAFDIYTADSPDLKRAAEMVRDMWNELGAQVNLKIYETNDLYQNVIRTRKYGALLFGQAIGKDRDLYAFWHSSQRNAPGLNVSMYANSKTDKILEDIRTTRDEEARATAYEEFDELIRYDVPAVFLYVPDFIYGVSRALKGMNLTSLSSPSDRWSGVSEWHVETEHIWRIFDRK